MSRLASFLCLIFFTVSCFGQEESDTITDDFSDLALRHNSIYAEAMGNGGYGSLSYERMLFKVPNRVLALRVGFSFTVDETRFNPIIPLEITVIFGYRHCFETGPGLTFSPGGEGHIFFFRAGYRLRTDRGILLRVAPMLLYLPGWHFGPFGGFSLGYSF